MNIFTLNENPNQCCFKADNEETNKTQEYSNLIPTLSPQNLNCSMEPPHTGVQMINPRNTKAVPMQKLRSMYKGELYQNWI